MFSKFSTRLPDTWSVAEFTNTHRSKDIIARFKESIKGLTARNWALAIGGIFAVGLIIALLSQFLLGAFRPCLMFRGIGGRAWLKT